MSIIYDFDKEFGVPLGHYYLWKTIQFSDFEVDAQEEILVHSKNREALVEYAQQNGLTLKSDSWPEYGISQRTDPTEKYLFSIVGKPDENGRREWVRPEMVAAHWQEMQEAWNKQAQSNLGDVYLSQEALEDVKAWTNIT